MCVCVCVCVIYKPWLVGKFDKYMIRVQGQRKFATDKP